MSALLTEAATVWNMELWFGDRLTCSMGRLERAGCIALLAAGVPGLNKQIHSVVLPSNVWLSGSSGTQNNFWDISHSVGPCFTDGRHVD